MGKSRLSKNPYKGTKDFYPEDVFYRNYIFQTWEKVAKSFGYEEYDTPIIEEANLYRVKSGEDLANNQLYNFTDKGGREIALRPEMTPSLVRIISARRNELVFPLRLFNIGRYYRYEKPQRGRTREFFQLNIDLFGIPGLEAEIEIIKYISAVMEEFKAPKETYELRLNNRYLLEYILNEYLNVSENIKPKVVKAIDTYLKMEKEEFNEYLLEIGLNTDQIIKLNEYLNWNIEDLQNIKEKSRGAMDIINLFEMIDRLKISNVSFSPYIVRGLQYYTGTVMEMYDIGSKENPRALFGGGRYDNLMEIFDEKNVPAIGLGWGDVTTMDYLRTYNLLPDYTSDIDVYVTLMDESLYTRMWEISNFLRDNGLSVQMQLEKEKLGNQLKYASKKNIPWAIILGEEEEKTGILKLKDMQTGEQFDLSVEEALNRIVNIS